MTETEIIDPATGWVTASPNGTPSEARPEATLTVAADAYRACVADSQQAREDLADTVRAAVAGGMSEVQAARIAGVGRMTVRKWVGK